MKLLKSGHPGEIVISSARSPLIDGPYRFKPGGYVFSFEQHHRGRLTVSLESTPTSSHAPYQALIKTTSRQGRAEVRIAGTLYVHVVSESGYLLRFRPKHP